MVNKSFRLIQHVSFVWKKSNYHAVKKQSPNFKLSGVFMTQDRSSYTKANTRINYAQNEEYSLLSMISSSRRKEYVFITKEDSN